MTARQRQRVSYPWSSGQLPVLLWAPDPAETTWQDFALCAQTDPEAFYPDKGGSVVPAKKVCMRCQVRTECLEWALDNGERFGIWGGKSERERRNLLRKRGQAAA